MERGVALTRQPRMRGVANNERLCEVEAARSGAYQTFPPTGVDLRRSRISFPVPFRKSYPCVSMMKTRQNGYSDNGSVSLDRPMLRSILL